MTIQAKDVKLGMQISFGWGQWLTVTNVDLDYQKNGKELRVFKGSSVQEVTRTKNRRYPKLGSKDADSVTIKSTTKVNAR